MSAKKPKREKVKNYKGIHKLFWTDQYGVKTVKYGYSVMVNGKRVSEWTFPSPDAAMAAKLEKMKELTRTNGTADQISFETLIDKKVDHGVRVDFRRDSHIRDYEDLKKKIPETVLKKKVLDVTIEDMRAVVETVNGNGQGKKKVYALLRAVFTWYKKHMKVDHNPMLEINVPKVNKRETKEKNGVKYCPPKSGLDLLFPIFPQEERDFYEALFLCAARAGYADESGFASMTWADVDFENKRVYLHHYKNGGREASVAKTYWLPMGEKLKEILERRLEHKSKETDLVFWRINQRTGAPRKWSTNDDTILKRYCEKVGIKKFSGGAIRNARAGYLIDEHRISPYALQRYLGHSRVETTFKYIESLGKSFSGDALIGLVDL